MHQPFLAVRRQEGCYLAIHLLYPTMPPEFISPLSLYGFKLLAVIKDGVRVAEKSLVISLGQLPLWARSTHPTMKKADLQVECRLSVVNPHNTAHSTEPAPQAAMAELPPDVWLDVNVLEVDQAVLGAQGRPPEWRSGGRSAHLQRRAAFRETDTAPESPVRAVARSHLHPAGRAGGRRPVAFRREVEQLSAQGLGQAL